MQFSYNEANNKWSGAYDIYWKDTKTPIDVYGYYPWSSPGSISEYAFEVQKDQAKAGQMVIWEAMRRVIFFGERRRRWNLQRK